MLLEQREDNSWQTSFRIESIPSKDWVHVAFSRKGNELVSFLNGNIQGKVTIGEGQIHDPQQPLLIGCKDTGTQSVTKGFNGYLQDIRITKNAVYTSCHFIAYDLNSKIISEKSDPYCHELALNIQSNTETETDAITDISDNNHTILKEGDVHHEVDTKILGESSLYFDGEDDYLSIGDAQSFKFLHNGETDFTIECWVNLKQHDLDAVYSSVIVQTASSSLRVGTKLQISNTGFVSCPIFVGQQDKFYRFVESKNPIELNKWYHIALVFRSNELYLYIDGNDEGNSINNSNRSNFINEPSSSNSYGSLLVGYNYDQASDNYLSNIYIQDLRISKKAVYTSCFVPLTSLHGECEVYPGGDDSSGGGSGSDNTPTPTPLGNINTPTPIAEPTPTPTPDLYNRRTTCDQPCDSLIKSNTDLSNVTEIWTNYNPLIAGNVYNHNVSSQITDWPFVVTETGPQYGNMPAFIYESETYALWTETRSGGGYNAGFFMLNHEPETITADSCAKISFKYHFISKTAGGGDGMAYGLVAKQENNYFCNWFGNTLLSSTPISREKELTDGSWTRIGGDGTTSQPEWNKPTTFGVFFANSSSGTVKAWTADFQICLVHKEGVVTPTPVAEPTPTPIAEPTPTPTPVLQTQVNPGSIRLLFADGTISSTACSNDTTPSWTWSKPTGAVKYIVKVDEDGVESEVNAETFTSSELSEGGHTLYVRAVNASGDLSAWSTYYIFIDTTPPPKPNPSSYETTTHRQPLWEWPSVSNSGNSFNPSDIQYEIQLDDNEKGTTISNIWPKFKFN